MWSVLFFTQNLMHARSHSGDVQIASDSYEILFVLSKGLVFFAKRYVNHKRSSTNAKIQTTCSFDSKELCKPSEEQLNLKVKVNGALNTFCAHLFDNTIPL